MMDPNDSVALACACGKVRCEAARPLIAAVTCYCDDCQAAAREIEARPGAPAILDAEGGTALTLFHADRLRVTSGSELLVPFKLSPKSVTNRYVATCCHSLFHLGFDKGPHWVSVLSARWQSPPPPPQWRVMTRYSPQEDRIPKGAHKSRGFALGFLLRALTSRFFRA